jgi:uncharacterized membrane protein
MVGALLVIFGAMGIAGAVFAKNFYVGDGIREFKANQRMPTWLGRLVCVVAGVGLVAVGIKMLIVGR